MLDSGERVPEAEATYLAPVEPSKILAVHLTYRSRVDEYVARPPAEPAYFVKPPEYAQRPPRRAAAARRAPSTSTTRASSRSSSAAA